MVHPHLSKPVPYESGLVDFSFLSCFLRTRSMLTYFIASALLNGTLSMMNRPRHMQLSHSTTANKRKIKNPYSWFGIIIKIALVKKDIDLHADVWFLGMRQFTKAWMPIIGRLDLFTEKKYMWNKIKIWIVWILNYNFGQRVTFPVLNLGNTWYVDPMNSQNLTLEK